VVATQQDSSLHLHYLNLPQLGLQCCMFNSYYFISLYVLSTGSIAFSAPFAALSYLTCTYPKPAP
jgi:hypothetical protein